MISLPELLALKRDRHRLEWLLGRLQGPGGKPFDRAFVDAAMRSGPPPTFDAKTGARVVQPGRAK